MLGIILHLSPNKAPRQSAVRYIILHGTWMADEEETLARLCDPQAEVSCHYFIHADGTLRQLVAEDEVAWHAGKSAWKDDIGLNASSLGIELANPGDGSGEGAPARDEVVPYTPAQYITLVNLLRDIQTRLSITPDHVLAHSDIAPARKTDPGAHFDWRILEAEGVACHAPCGHIPTAEELRAYGYRHTDDAVLKKAYALRISDDIS